MINYSTLYDDIYDIVAPLIDPNPLIRGFQSDTKPAEVYCTYRISDLKELGFSINKAPDQNGVAEIHHVYSLTLRFTFIGPECSDDAVNLHMKLSRPSVHEAFNAIGLCFYDRTTIRDVPKLMSTGYEDRSTFDFKYYVRVVDLDEQGWIEFIELTSEIEKPDGSVVYSDTEIIDIIP